MNSFRLSTLGSIITKQGFGAIFGMFSTKCFKFYLYLSITHFFLLAKARRTAYVVSEIHFFVYGNHSNEVNPPLKLFFFFTFLAVLHYWRLLAERRIKFSLVERIWAFVCFSEHFRDVSWQFSGQIVSTCADVFNIFKFELNPLDGRGMWAFVCFSGHFRGISGARYSYSHSN
jgi:hypothetical protein